MIDTVDLAVPSGFDIDELRQRIDEIDRNGLVYYQGEENVLGLKLAEGLFYSLNKDKEIESMKLFEGIMNCGDARCIAEAAHCIAIAYCKGSHGYPLDYK